MVTYKFEDANLKITMDCSGITPLFTNSSWLQEFRALLDTFDSSVEGGLDKITLTQTATNPPKYHYEFKSLDGRQWEQDLEFLAGSGTNPYQTFNVVSPWKEAEFSTNRAVRASIVQAITTYGMENLTVKW